MLSWLMLALGSFALGALWMGLVDDAICRDPDAGKPLSSPEAEAARAEEANNG